MQAENDRLTEELFNRDDNSDDPYDLCAPDVSPLGAFYGGFHVNQ